MKYMFLHAYKKYHQIKKFIPHMPEIAKFSTKYFILNKVYTYEGGIKQLFHGLYTCTGKNSLAKARGLSPRTGGQTVV